MPTVTILMSTYNGERFIREQLDSLLNQKDVDFKIRIRDDGSTDNTINIIKEYMAKDARISYYTGPNLKPAKSFLDLLVTADDTEYYALCDQDDVWDENKLACAVKMLEQQNAPELPLLYYSNLRVVDKELNFIRNSHSEPCLPMTKYSCLIEAFMTGCTCVINHKAKEYISIKLPDYCSMHDTWIYMVCSIFGKLVYDYEPHISYRQHENNVIGTYNKKSIGLYVEKIARLFDRSLQPRYQNAISFVDCFGDKLEGENLEKIMELVDYKKNFKNRIRLIKDKDLKSASRSRDIRNKLLILNGII